MSTLETSPSAPVRELTGQRLSRFRSGDLLVVIAFLVLALIVILPLLSHDRLILVRNFRHAIEKELGIAYSTASP